MIGYIAAYIGGAASGISLLLLHQFAVRRAVCREQARARRDVSRLQAENRQLREDVQAYEMCSTAASAREQGKVVGMREGRNMSEFERFQQALNPNGKRKVNLGGGQ